MAMNDRCLHNYEEFFGKVKIDDFTFLIKSTDRKIANLLCESF